MESACLHEITDRELIGGLMTAVIALAEKLTGERLTVYVKTEVGEVPISAGRTCWSKDLPAAEVRYGRLAEQPSTRF
jgi:hypothetical protein